MPNYEVTVELDRREYMQLMYVLEAEDADEAREAMQAWVDDDPAGVALEASVFDSETEIDTITVTETDVEAIAKASDWL